MKNNCKHGVGEKKGNATCQLPLHLGVTSLCLGSGIYISCFSAERRRLRITGLGVGGGGGSISPSAMLGYRARYVQHCFVEARIRTSLL